MDTRRLIITILISLTIIIGWQIMVSRWVEQHREVVERDPAPAPPVVPVDPPTVVDPTDPAAPVVDVAPKELVITPPEVAAPQQVRIGQADAFPMEVLVTTAGAGIDGVTLKAYPAPDGESVYTFQHPFDPKNPATRPLATRAIVVNGNSIDVSNAVWQLAEQTDQGARFVLELTEGEAPLVRVHKTYRLFDREAENQGYELSVVHSFENLSARALRVQTRFNGTITPPREIQRSMDLQAVAGHDDVEEVRVLNHYTESFDETTPTRDLTRGDRDRAFLWAGTSSVYFGAIVRPVPLDPERHVPEYIQRVTAEVLNPRAEYHQRTVRVVFETTELELSAGESIELEKMAFFGPKRRTLLYAAHYVAYPRSYDKTLVITAGPCGWCTFHWLINGLVWLLERFQFVMGDWGLAIIALVILVRAILHPVTKRSQISLMKMGKMAPEMERLKKKYGDDKDELNKQMMLLYKEQGFTPLLGCLPMFLQMPIWIALWSALYTTFELRQAPFLYGLTWINDLARPDRLIEFTPIPLPFGMQISALNLLPLLMAVVFYLQVKLTPKPPVTTEQQRTQQKMMQWMSMIFPIFLYNMPSGLNLYILTSTTIGVVESKVIRDHIKKREEAEKEGKVIVDAGPARGAKRKGKVVKKEEPKKGCLAGWLAEMQAKAEEIRRQAERK